MTQEPRKPSENEEEYFARVELDRRRQWEKERRAKMSEEEKEQLKQLHHMKCPKCGSDLHTVELNGVKMDQCTSCQGSWLDAGEMERLLEHEHPILNRFKHLIGV